MDRTAPSRVAVGAPSAGRFLQNVDPHHLAAQAATAAVAASWEVGASIHRHVGQMYCKTEATAYVRSAEAGKEVIWNWIHRTLYVIFGISRGEE
jgi:hypothetical protein